jgi:hypothetical protein
VTEKYSPQRHTRLRRNQKSRDISRKACPERSRRDAKHVLSDVEGAAKKEK